MNSKPYLLFMFIVIALPRVSVAGQSEQYAAEQKVFTEKYAAELKVSSEKYAAELKVSSEKYTAELKVSSEKYAAELKVSSEKSNAEQMAIHKKYNDEQIAIHKKYNDEQIAIHKKYNDEQIAIHKKYSDEQMAIYEKYNAEQKVSTNTENRVAEPKVQTERYVTTQMAATASAVNADNGIANKIYSFLKTGLLENIYKLFQGGPSTPAQYPSGVEPLIGMGITGVEQGPEMNKTAITFTKTQQQEIGVAAVTLLSLPAPPTEKELMDEVTLIDQSGLGIMYNKTVIRNAILDKAVQQCMNCSVGTINALKALKR